MFDNMVLNIYLSIVIRTQMKLKNEEGAIDMSPPINCTLDNTNNLKKYHDKALPFINCCTCMYPFALL